MNKLPILISLLLFVGISIPAWSQTDPRFYDYPQNHLKWYSIESDHFIVHFQEGNSRSAQVTSRIAEEIYGPITSLYKYEPDTKVSIVLKDREDYSNGAAYFFDNKIDIWVPSLDTPLRGSHNWLRNVITHEFVHIVQIQAALKRERKYPALYLQWLSYEKVRRPDVLYGFPNGIASLPFASVNVPAWFAEGTAQYQIEGLLYDTWDSHRDMILRTRILSDTYFNLIEMGTFSSKTSIERETVYNQGYAFVIYMAQRFGDDVLRRISEALGEKGVYKVEEAIEFATGIDGNTVFDDWIAERKEFYTSGIESLTYTDSEYIESEGFFNFFPKPSPANDDAVAYLSNREKDYSLLSLYIKQNGTETEIAQVDQRDHHIDHNHADALKPLIMALNTTYSFSPDGEKIVYTINRKNHYGEFYSDLFIYELESGESTRLTNSARIQSPAWSPDGSQIAALKYEAGTQNLILIDAENPEEQALLTNYEDGETLFTPNWHPDGNEIYYAYADYWGRNIHSIDLNTNAVQSILENDFIDYRDPFISDDGSYMYYSSDPDGIFNIYRRHLTTGETDQITSVLGGSFMPFVKDDQLYFSEYEKDGYKIKKANLVPSSSAPGFGRYEPIISEFSFDPGSIPAASYLNDFDDKDIDPLGDEIVVKRNAEPHTFEIETQGESDVREYKPYEDTFTSFSYFPVLRFDNYTKRNGQNGTLLKNGQVGKLGENLLRDVKPGVYFASRDVLDRLSIFGGIMLGVASRDAESVGDFFKPNRLLKLDRDVFFTAEYRGLPFIKKSWSPTVAIEVFNLHRNVRDGLSIEEFPCTSCLPDTTTVDIGYEVWEANLFFRSKLSRRSLLELGIGYSPYQVQTDNFFSRELDALISGSSSQYYRATTLSASYTFDYYNFTTDADIAPVGLKGYLRYQYQPAELLEEYEIKDGTLVPIFNSIKNHSAEIHLRYGFRTFGDQAFQARVRGFSYFNKPDDAFYTDYIGGFLGMRSYPFFAIGGNRTAFTSISWFTPIFKNINKQVGPYTFDKVYARFFFEAGNGWYPGGAADNNSGLLDSGTNIKKGIGAELRLASSGYYLFPLRFFVSASYGFDEFTLTLPEDFVTGSQSNRVTYGRELLFHFGLTFDFELL
ncbi:MAG: hypothetical protein ED557_04895 [Balneola sp.]|nr:MAG: hypothetical protein ED557_04895 [Balneola sp.]